MPIPYEPLPYGYEDLEPKIDQATMDVHYNGHYKTYVDKYNAAIQPYPALANKTLEEVLANDLALVPAAIKTQVRNNGGGALNHALFWKMMAKPGAGGGGSPGGDLAEAIADRFGSFADFKTQFASAAVNDRFGSGWAWLVVNPEGNLELMTTANQDPPIMTGHKPVLGADVWEHAYYLKHKNKRADYVVAFWDVVNWTQCGDLYGAAMQD